MIDRSREPSNSAVSQTTGYIINLGVASIVIAMLMMNAQGVVHQLRSTSAQAELEVTGDRVASTLSHAAEMQQAADSPDGEVPLDTTSLVSSQLGGYTVNVTDAASNESGEVRLRTGMTDVETVVVPFNVSSDVHGGEWSSAETTMVTYNESGVYFE